VICPAMAARCMGLMIGTGGFRAISDGRPAQTMVVCVLGSNSLNYPAVFSSIPRLPLDRLSEHLNPAGVTAGRGFFDGEPFENKASDWGWFRGRLVALDPPNAFIVPALVDRCPVPGTRCTAACSGHLPPFRSAYSCARSMFAPVSPALARLCRPELALAVLRETLIERAPAIAKPPRAVVVRSLLPSTAGCAWIAP
jgi:hypothetical protein